MIFCPESTIEPNLFDPEIANQKTRITVSDPNRSALEKKPEHRETQN